MIDSCLYQESELEAVEEEVLVDEVLPKQDSHMGL